MTKNKEQLSSYNNQIATMLEEGIFKVIDDKRIDGSHIT